MTTNERGDDATLRLRVRLLVATVRGAVSGAMNAGLTWLIEQFTEAE